MKQQRLKRMKQELTVFEGFREKPYLCSAGKLTIGIGRNLEDRGISAQEAETLLETDIFLCWESVKNKLPWVLELPLVAQDVLVHMCFNLGIKGLLSFVKTLEALRHQNWREAALEMKHSKWAKQVGHRATELSERIQGLEDLPVQRQATFLKLQKCLKTLETELEVLCCEK